MEYKVYNTYYPVYLRGLEISINHYTWTTKARLIYIDDRKFLLYRGMYLDIYCYCLIDFRSRIPICAGKTIKEVVEKFNGKRTRYYSFIVTSDCKQIIQKSFKEIRELIEDPNLENKVDFFVAGIKEFEQYMEIK